MNQIFAELLPLAIFLFSFVFLLCAFLIVRYKRRDRKSPLTIALLRSPGESIQNRINQLQDDLSDHFMSMTLFPTMCFSAYLSARYLANAYTSPVYFLVPAIGTCLWSGRKLVLVMQQLQNERLGLECERAVGQELNSLMLEGYRVFHDFPADKFNIDHVVVGPNGVFAVETKGRSKSIRGKGQENVRVVYDGQTLQFPNWKEHEPIDQAKRQASWLGSWLSKAVGEEVEVIPVLALPGWFIERRKSDFCIFNGKNPQFLTKLRTDRELSPHMIQRVSHQLEQQCRNECSR